MSTFKKIITLKSYWKSVLGLSVAFIVVYNLIMAAFDGFNFTALITKATEEPLRFLIANVLSGLLYGMIIAYFQFSKKLKEQQR